MPTQAKGVGLGMTWAKLRQLRPHALLDDHSVWEPIHRNQSNLYLFGPTPKSIRRSGTSGTLQVVIASLTLPNEQISNYRSAVSKFRDDWSGLAGAPTYLLHYSVQIADQTPFLKEALIWDLPRICLMLQYDSASSAVLNRNRLVRVIIYRPEVSISHFLPQEAIPMSSERNLKDPCLMP
jgi:hypothetical protein